MIFKIKNLIVKIFWLVFMVLYNPLVHLTFFLTSKSQKEFKERIKDSKERRGPNQEVKYTEEAVAVGLTIFFYSLIIFVLI